MRSPTIIPSRYQTEIFNVIERTNGLKKRPTIVIKSAPGSGKTTTLIECAKRATGRYKIFLARTRSVVEELKKRLPEGFDVKTLNGLGHGAIWKALDRQNIEVDKCKYNKLCAKRAVELVREGHSELDVNNLARQLEVLTRYVRVTLTDASDAEKVARTIHQFSLDIPNAEILIPEIGKVLDEGMKVAREELVIDPTDQIWLPSVWDLTLWKYECVFVDEAQDLSAGTLELVLKSRYPGSLTVFAGDENQGIMGFAGALGDSIDRIVKRTNATVMPLRISYRCPKSHVRLAQLTVPDIEAAPDAIEGTIADVLADDVPNVVKKGDVVLSRTIGSLVDLCLQLLVRDIKAAVIGENVEQLLVSLIEEVEKLPGYSFQQFNKFLQAYKAKRVADIESLKQGGAVLQNVLDKIRSLQICYERLSAYKSVKTTDQFKLEISRLLDSKNADIRLYTIHKFKGLEAERIVILNYDSLPLTWEGQKKWEEEEERKIKFVAETRSKRVLIRVMKSLPAKATSF